MFKYLWYQAALERDNSTEELVQPPRTLYIHRYITGNTLYFCPDEIAEPWNRQSLVIALSNTLLEL